MKKQNMWIQSQDKNVRLKSRLKFEEKTTWDIMAMIKARLPTRRKSKIPHMDKK